MNINATSRKSRERELSHRLMGGVATNIAGASETPIVQSNPGPTSATTNDPLTLNRVVPRLEAVRLAGVSEATWDRLERRGEGPRPRIRISERRVGYRIRDLLSWLDTRRSERQVA
jgi:predicted DNA-binding transcriptional regulator AlpA